MLASRLGRAGEARRLKQDRSQRSAGLTPGPALEWPRQLAPGVREPVIGRRRCDVIRRVISISFGDGSPAPAPPRGKLCAEVCEWPGNRSAQWSGAAERAESAVMAVAKFNDANLRKWADFALRAATGPRPLMRLIANLRDLAVLAPASLGLIVLLSWICARRDAAAYAAAAVVCLAAALVAKLASAAWSGRYSLFGVREPERPRRL